MKRSWKSSITGVAAILGVVTKILNDVLQGKPINIGMEETTIIVLGVGQIFSKDHDVTGDGK